MAKLSFGVLAANLLAESLAFALAGGWGGGSNDKSLAVGKDDAIIHHARGCDMSLQD